MHVVRASHPAGRGDPSEKGRSARRAREKLGNRRPKRNRLLIIYVSFVTFPAVSVFGSGGARKTRLGRADASVSRND